MNVKGGFEILRSAVDSVTADLGGSQAMRLVVARSAHDLLRTCTEASFSLEDRREMLQSYYLFATYEAFERASTELRRIFSLEGLSPVIALSGPYQGGKLVLRDCALRFETGSGGFALALAHQERHAEKWRVFLTTGGEAIADRYGKKPSVGTSYAKSVDGVLRSFRRLAEEVFRTEVLPSPAAE
ncbi:hypothetical protein BSFA1_81050 (plasmid) [Burkholderia sp. SFA1]|nr:hypothetical protein BYI23_E001990 [Burkholderia sp. YI23]BBQ02977.1 hypothetical protein BSFA1_81050 [Burkholderia sp. SFA1]